MLTPVKAHWCILALHSLQPDLNSVLNIIKTIFFNITFFFNPLPLAKIVPYSSEQVRND